MPNNQRQTQIRWHHQRPGSPSNWFSSPKYALKPESVNFQSPSDLLDSFESHIVQTAVDVAARQKRNDQTGSQNQSKISLTLSKKETKPSNSAWNNHLIENQNHLRETRRELLRQKRAAKRHWQLTYASQCKKVDFLISPKEAWSMVFKLMEGFQSHHRNYLPSNFRNKNGVEAKTDTENAQILNAHFQSLFNSKVQIDPTVGIRVRLYKQITSLV